MESTFYILSHLLVTTLQSRYYCSYFTGEEFRFTEAKNLPKLTQQAWIDPGLTWMNDPGAWVARVQYKHTEKGLPSFALLVP